MKLLIILLLTISCGKVNHTADPVKVDVQVPTEYSAQTSIALRRMYEEWLYICRDNFPDVESLEYKACKQKAVDNFLDIVDGLEEVEVED